MGGDHEDKGPYRTSVDPPPPSDPVRSPRVLSALAQLRSARGDVDASAALNERAERARSTLAPRPLGRCDHAALEMYDRRRARDTYESWLRAAEARPTRDEYRVEVLCALSIVDDERPEERLRAALRCGSSVPDDAPPPVAALLARTLRQLGRHGAAAAVLSRVDTSQETYPLPLGVLDLERAHVAFNGGDTDTAGLHVRRAARMRSSAYGEKHPAFAECATLGGRILRRLGYLRESAEMLDEAIQILRGATPRDGITEADAMAAIAELRWQQGRRSEALAAAGTARFLVTGNVTSAALPTLDSLLSVFSGEPARDVERDIAAIRRRYER